MIPGMPPTRSLTPEDRASIYSTVTKPSTRRTVVAPKATSKALTMSAKDQQHLALAAYGVLLVLYPLAVFHVINGWIVIAALVAAVLAEWMRPWVCHLGIIALIVGGAINPIVGGFTVLFAFALLSDLK